MGKLAAANGEAGSRLLGLLCIGEGPGGEMYLFLIGSIGLLVTQTSQVVQSQVTYRKEGYLRKTIKHPPPTLGYLEPIREHAGMQTGDGQVLISLAISLGSPYMKRMRKKGHCSKA